MTVGHESPDDRDRLAPMAEHDFAEYLERAVKNYAEEKVRAGNWHPSEALERAEHACHALLIDGVATAGHHLFTLEAGEAVIGIIWFAEANSAPRKTAFIYDFWIEEGERHKGYGTAALEALEDKVTDLGLTAISLHVFGHNRAAVAL